MSPATTPALKLNNGVEIPALGLGVFQSPPEETAAAVEAALREGYRLIDTAAAYGNEREVGDAVRASGLDRSEVFLETKIWISDYGCDETLHGFEKSAGKLGVEQIDLLILHQALPSAFDRTLEAYRALETLLADGKVRAIGVSKLQGRPPHPAARPRPGRARGQPDRAASVLQPGRPSGLRRTARDPLAGVVADRRHHLLPRRRAHQHPARPRHRRDRPGARQEPRPGHAALGIQHGRSVIPKSTKPTRIAENIDVFDFELTADEMTAIDGLDTGRRGGPEPITLEAFGRDILEA
jgi:diketogulonate reductase-like aldo/keto reductase